MGPFSKFLDEDVLIVLKWAGKELVGKILSVESETLLLDSRDVGLVIISRKEIATMQIDPKNFLNGISGR